MKQYVSYLSFMLIICFTTIDTIFRQAVFLEINNIKYVVLFINSNFFN